VLIGLSQVQQSVCLHSAATARWRRRFHWQFVAEANSWCERVVARLREQPWPLNAVLRYLTTTVPTPYLDLSSTRILSRRSTPDEMWDSCGDIRGTADWHCMHQSKSVLDMLMSSISLYI